MTPERYLLYLEDDPIELIKFQSAFNEINPGITIKSFSNGQEGWDFLIKNPNNAPSVIVLDLKMPVMNGFEFLEKIKNNVSFRKIPVIILSTSNHENDILYSFDHQVAGYFVKPFSTKDYNNIIAKVNEYWQTSKTPK